jgi:hypothetical protein
MTLPLKNWEDLLLERVDIANEKISALAKGKPYKKSEVKGEVDSKASVK